MAQHSSRFLRNERFVAVYAWADFYIRTFPFSGSKPSTRFSPRRGKQSQDHEMAYTHRLSSRSYYINLQCRANVTHERHGSLLQYVDQVRGTLLEYWLHRIQCNIYLIIYSNSPRLQYCCPICGQSEARLYKFERNWHKRRTKLAVYYMTTLWP